MDSMDELLNVLDIKMKEILNRIRNADEKERERLREIIEHAEATLYITRKDI